MAFLVFCLVDSALDNPSETSIEPIVGQQVGRGGEYFDVVVDDFLELGRLDIGVEAALQSDED